MLKLSVLLALAISITPAGAQFQPPAAGAYEEPPTLDAAAILRPELVQGPHFKVRGEVPTYAGHNQFTIESDYGAFDADGNSQLVTRVAEINAIAKLREVSSTEEYKEALKAAAKSPVALAKNLAKDPVKTVTGVPKGIWKFMNRAGQTAKDGEKRAPNPYEDRSVESLIGFSKTKRDLALKLGVDPYSSNEALQKELNGIAWASFGGKLTVTLALAPVGGGAGAAITALNVSDTAGKALLDLSPNDLRRANLDKLLEMKVPREDVVAFLNNPAYSPTHATLLVEALGRLSGVAGRAVFVQSAAEATDETDAIFYQRTAEVLAGVHDDRPLVEIVDALGFPAAIATDGTLVLGLEWDYASWTARAEDFVKKIRDGNFSDHKTTGCQIVLSGVASPRTKEQLAVLGIRLTEQALTSPLR